ncbi:DUF4845 domain-containing protein [Methyloterricola oryzae]|uniref:DUF4845 domain-containing protein n=1 Tax=Methyloterricola oryzae TaxID=1495050 RepID=UPI0005EAD67F|nr:DUF4845 domain-containing protein [Methyloterricola oryzae]
MSRLSRQSGMTMIGFLLMFMLVGFFTLLTIKLVPIYLEHYKIVSSLEALKSDPDLATRPKEEILKTLEKRWDINMVNRVTAQDVKITKQGGRLTVQIAYEAVEHIMGNVDVLVTFDDSIEAGGD